MPVCKGVDVVVMTVPKLVVMVAMLDAGMVLESEVVKVERARPGKPTCEQAASM